MGIGIMGTQLQGPAIALDRFAALALLGQGHSKVVMRLGGGGPQFQQLPVGGGSFGEQALVGQGNAQVGQDDPLISPVAQLLDQLQRRLVRGQGDLRPMADDRSAMAELRTILLSREPLYARASAVVDTAGLSVDAAAARLIEAVGPVLQNEARAFGLRSVAL